MDSFETSTQFSQILRTLTPSMQALIRGAHFALKHHLSEDYLVHTIVEVVDDPLVDLNTKSTIFQFIEVLMHESFSASEQPKSVYNYPYVDTLKQLLPKVLLQTLPGTNCSSLYNVYCNLKNISKVLKFNYEEYDIKFNSINESFTVEDEENIVANVAFPQVNEDDEVETQELLIMTWNLLIKKKKQSQYERLRLLRHKALCMEKLIEEDEMFNIRLSDKAVHMKEGGDPQLLSKRQILARMEDDRESHKRSKENLWMVSRPRDLNGITEDEFLTSYWNKYKVMNEAEEKTLFAELEELNQLVALSYKDKQF